jgi:hypothetical protein
MGKLDLPIDGQGNAIQVTPPVVALEETYDATISTSTEITLNTGTTLIEVGAIDKTILLKWGTDNASTTDFDEVIPLNTVRTFYVPAGVAAVNFIEQAATAILVVVEK